MLSKAFQDANEERADGRPILGVYRCLYCGMCYALKRRLQLHYQEVHMGSMPNYEGEEDSYLRRSEPFADSNR
jgi:hypothetical protein